MLLPCAQLCCCPAHASMASTTPVLLLTTPHLDGGLGQGEVGALAAPVHVLLQICGEVLKHLRRNITHAHQPQPKVRVKRSTARLLPPAHAHAVAGPPLYGSQGACRRMARAPHAVLLPAGQQLRCLQSCAVSPKLYSVWLADPAQHKLLLTLLAWPAHRLHGCTAAGEVRTRYRQGLSFSSTCSTHSSLQAWRRGNGGQGPHEAYGLTERSFSVLCWAGPAAARSRSSGGHWRSMCCCAAAAAVAAALLLDDVVALTEHLQERHLAQGG